MNNLEGYRHLSAQIIVEVIEDYRSSKDPFYREALLRWFATSWGNSLCELAGIDAKFIREVISNEKNR